MTTPEANANEQKKEPETTSEVEKVPFDQFSFDQRIRSGLSACKFTAPTPVQQAVIPILLERRDTIALANTGTGKTAAFLLPLLQYLADEDALKRGPVRALILAPTRELVLQIQKTCIALGLQTGYRCGAVYGGAGAAPQKKAAKQSTIIVATPGRLLDFMNQKEIRLGGIDTLIIDEADRMFDLGFLPDIQKILDRVPSKRTTAFFSATMPKPIEQLACTYTKDPKVIDVRTEEAKPDITHELFTVPPHLKKKLLLTLMPLLLNDSDNLVHKQKRAEHSPHSKADGGIIIFTNTKETCRALERTLANKFGEVAALHSDLSQSKRNKMLEKMQTGEARILVATDLVARGIDLDHITHIIQFDTPDSADKYIHRVGRTARAYRKGTAITLLGEKELMRMLQMEQDIGKSFALRKLANFNYNEPSGNNKSDTHTDSHRKPSFKRKPQGKKPQGKKPSSSRSAKPRRKR
ncbi:DEAD/DEAH box helicase [Halodesulfovibrio marinisediminis]|uniref:Superfamily II DNA and RNA helicase n=1 Tax=Halodesulfovibrio marinisediminis DSM 17456 TaxID=1121457 RepID=A0A1N6H3D5_9BACT|nr:DEAD/DEAH box helicase [Halodesulfovibrio marinisediminis]SIO14195.1 Superfamily II DNA and RNA helicase [Halodesulfovibrio marinisediminis DSM 17456]